MLTLPPGEKKGLLARFKEFMDPQERTPNVLRKPRPDKPNVKRSVSFDGDGAKSGKERFAGLSRLRESLSGSKTRAEDADTPTAPLEAERNDNAKQKRSSWFQRRPGPSKSSRDRETNEADQQISQTPWEGDPPPTQSQVTPPTTALSRTLSAPTQPTRLSIRNAFPPRRRPQMPLQAPSLASTLSDHDLDKWARNGDRVRNNHFIPPLRDPFAGSEQHDPVVPAPWTAGEQKIPDVPGPLQARRRPSRGNLRNSRRDGRPVSQPTLLTSGNPADLRNDTDPFPSFQQPSDLQFDASRGQNNAWVESPAPEETYLSDARLYGSSFPVLASPRPPSPSREASIAAGEAIAQEAEKYVAYRPPPLPSIGNPAQQRHDYTAAAERRLGDNSVAKLDAGPDSAAIQSSTYGVVNVAGFAILSSVPGREIPAQQEREHEAAEQRLVDNTVAELDAGPVTTIPTSNTYGVVDLQATSPLLIP
ncbi:hypothetical protein LTS10_009075 [Elasticomyces elasticus]|nr:hypothetical protein LTS10_009075 [Elasticomyces elasticus]